MTHPALIERITRSLAYMLRHQPEEFDLEVDDHGYAEIGDVLRALNERLGESVVEEDVREAVESGDRQRYEFVGDRIRALYGHSIEVLPGEPAQPPENLYVGVSRADADRARRYGLRPGRRRFLHLALTPEDALETAQRTAREHEVIVVRALDAWEEGINFYDRISLYLSDPIPTQFLEGAAPRGQHAPREHGHREHSQPTHGHRAVAPQRPAPVRHAREDVVYGQHDDGPHGHGEHEHDPHGHVGAPTDTYADSGAPSAAPADHGGPPRRRRGRRGRRGGEAPAGGEHAGPADRGDAPRYDDEAPREPGLFDPRPGERADPRPYDRAPRGPERAPRGDQRGDQRAPAYGDRGPRAGDAPRGGERSQGGFDRPRDDRPRAPHHGGYDDRPRGPQQHREDRPRHDRPAFDDRPRPVERPRFDERPRDDRAQDERGHGRHDRAPRHEDAPRRDAFPARDREPAREPRREQPRHRDEVPRPAPDAYASSGFGGGLEDSQRQPAPPRPSAPRPAPVERAEERAPERRPQRAPEAPAPADDGGFGAGVL